MPCLTKTFDVIFLPLLKCTVFCNFAGFNKHLPYSLKSVHCLIRQKAGRPRPVCLTALVTPKQYCTKHSAGTSSALIINHPPHTHGSSLHPQRFFHEPKRRRYSSPLLPSYQRHDQQQQQSQTALLPRLLLPSATLPPLSTPNSNKNKNDSNTGMVVQRHHRRW